MVEWNSERENVKALADSKASVNASFKIEDGSIIVDSWGGLSNLSGCSKISYIRLMNDKYYNNVLSEKVYETRFQILQNLTKIVLTKNDCSENYYYLEIKYKDFYKNSNLLKVLLGFLETNHNAAATFFKSLTSEDITSNTTGIYISKKIGWARMGCNPDIKLFYFCNAYYGYQEISSTLNQIEDLTYFLFEAQLSHCYISAGKEIAHCFV